MMINRDCSDVVHHLVLEFNRDNPRFNANGIDSHLYGMELQTSLRQYKKEADKMIVYVTDVLNMDDEPVVFDGGRVLFSTDNQSEHFRTIKAIFSSLKSMSVYQKYIFNNIQSDNQNFMWDFVFEKNTQLVRSYTIKYCVTAVKIREVTLYTFGESAVLLTMAEFTNKE